ncbi:hypothetical protein HDA32_000001 [Spinactinospora alkalitolerans]|uniref:Uncharacterized protein n=1 Tax=Spinactinospora alkalitolerans TaxID=687207 RepID=A0A852TN85_9ACTN|nr:hypothetical protein [Spinactinospora alkalitolerans]
MGRSCGGRMLCYAPEGVGLLRTSAMGPCVPHQEQYKRPSPAVEGKS